VILPIRARHDFQLLSRDGRRIRRSNLWCRWCPLPQRNSTHVAFAIDRAFGSAVARNRLRRRWREILRQIDRTTPLPPGLLLIGPTPATGELTFDALRTSTAELIDAVRTTAVEPA
jgi:ribonuclease P protein component